MNILRRNSSSRFGWLSVGLLILILLLPLAVAGCTYGAQDPNVERQPGPPPPTVLSPAPEVGRLAPDFTLTDLEGNRITLSDYRGKVVFINFWASWCPPCRAEMPDIEALYQEYKDSDVVVIGVDIQESESTVRQFVANGGFSWTFVIDSTGEVTGKYTVSAIPTSFFLDRQGVIRAMTVGAMSKTEMESQLAKALE